MKRFFKMLGPKLTLLLVVGLLFLVIGMQNLEPANVRVLFWTFLEVPKLYLLLFAFLIGLFVGVLMSSLPQSSSKIQPPPRPAAPPKQTTRKIPTL